MSMAFWQKLVFFFIENRGSPAKPVPLVLKVLCQILRRAVIYFPHASILPCKPGVAEAMIFMSEGE